MKVSDAMAEAKYVVDANGNKTDVVIPLETWKKLLAVWKEQQENDSLPLPPLSPEEWERRWENLAQRVTKAWKSEKSTLEVLAEMRR